MLPRGAAAARLAKLVAPSLCARGASAKFSSRTASFGFEDVPEPEKAGLVGRVFGGVAPSYDLMNDLMSGGLHRLWKDRLVNRLQIFTGMRHVDVAGGTSDVARRVEERLQAVRRDALEQDEEAALQDCGRVTVVDVNLPMLEEGKKKLADSGLQWVQGDAESLPFEDASMDSYTIAFGIRNVTRIQRALDEVYRVLKPGGHFLCLEFSHVALPGLKQLYNAYSFTIIPQIGRLVAGDEASYRYLVESISRFPHQVEFAGMIRRSGLESVRYDNLSGGIVAIHSGFKPLR